MASQKNAPGRIMQAVQMVECGCQGTFIVLGGASSAALQHVLYDMLPRRLWLPLPCVAHRKP